LNKIYQDFQRNTYDDDKNDINRFYHSSLDYLPPLHVVTMEIFLIAPMVVQGSPALCGTSSTLPAEGSKTQMFLGGEERG